MQEISNIRLDLIKDLSKQEILSLTQTFINNVLGGHADKLETLAISQKIQLFLATLEKEIKSHSLVDLAKYKDSKASIMGVDMSQIEAGVKYDYSENAEWVKISEKIQNLDAKRKEIESFIKTLTAPKTELDEETGELIKWFPASKSSTTTIKFSIK